MAHPTIEERTWYTAERASAFLVHAPITFGHSQLKFEAPASIPEEDQFLLAAQHVSQCIARFRTVLAKCDLREWAALADYTGTSGEYTKTLVLKASANEPAATYKIHLVPCFASHLASANALFWARLDPGKKNQGGGFLHWVGQREHLVDYDVTPLDESAETRIRSFSLTGLAAALCK